MSNTNDFDAPDDLEQDVDQDMDFSEFDDSKKSSLASSWKSNPLIKFGLIGGAILMVIVLVSLFGGEAPKAPDSLVSRGDKNFKETPGTKEVSPVMKEALEEKNQQRIEEAQKQGGSAMPTPIDPPKTLLDAPTDESAGEDPLLRWKQMQEERAKAQKEEQQNAANKQTQTDPQRDSRVQSLAQSMNTQISTILGKDGKSSLQHMLVLTPVAKIQNADGSVTTISGNGVTDVTYQNGLTTPVKPPNVILAAGKVEYAQMMLEANSDIPGPVMALVATGTFSGSKLLGSFTAEEEYLVIKFNTLVTKKGTSVPITAYAVDPQTSLTGLATDVDHRYFKRIILPAAAKFIEGLGSAYAETTTTTSQSASSTVTTSENLDTKQEFGKGVEEAASQVADVLDEDGKNTKPLVRVRAGTPIGILFMASVTDQGILQARSGINPGAQQQAGQTQQGQTTNGGMYGLNPLQQLQMGLQGQQYLQQGLSNYYSNQQQNNGSTTTTPTSTGQ